MKKNGMKATTLRTTMVIIIIITIGIATFGFYYFQGKLNTYAISVGQTVSESTAGSSSNAQTIKKIQADIAATQAIADKSASITASSLDYQNQTIADLNKYASNTGISIIDYNFSQSATTAKTSSLAGGIGTSFITITLGNPISYTNLIKFLESIETNLPKMQLTGINISHDQNNSDTITVQPLTIEVYTK